MVTSGKTPKKRPIAARAGDFKTETSVILAMQNVPRRGIAWRNLERAG